MQLGRNLHELWRIRTPVFICLLLASLGAVWSVAKVSVAPPSVQPRALETSAASTRALVDAPSPSVLDLAVSVNDFGGMKDRALLVGNVMAAAPVREYIGRRAGVPAERIQVSSPVTPEWPRALADNGNKPSTTDILKWPDEYRVSVKVNPTVPVIDVFAQAPNLDAAKHLADATVQGMADYLRDQGREHDVPAAEQVHLQQLGRATGATINPGVSRKLALLTFVLVFIASGAGVLFIGRVRRGWASAALNERTNAAARSAEGPAG